MEESSPYFPTQAGGGGGSAPPIYELTDDSDDDFKPTSKRPKSIYVNECVKRSVPIETKFKIFENISRLDPNTECVNFEGTIFLL